MVDLKKFKGETFYLIGLGISGTSAAQALTHAGAEVWVWDDHRKHNADSKHLEGAQGTSAPRKTALRHCHPCDMAYSSLAALVLSPGVPLTHPSVIRARQSGVEIISDIELMFRAGLQARVLGITGTNGKSTVTALISHTLRQLGHKVEIGGNFGPATLDMKDPGPEGFVVLELSSYQLDLSPGYPLAVACLLNVALDHLDRHGSMDAYAYAKSKIFRKAEHKIVTGTDAWSRKIAAQSRATLIAPDNWPKTQMAQTLRGDHQRQNQAAAWAMLASLGFDKEKVLTAMISFPGIAHRQEILGQTDRWLFVNDSKATNVSSTIQALSAFSRIHWLAGGRGKDGGFENLKPFLTQVEKAYIYGENADELARFCQDYGLPSRQFSTLTEAFANAISAAGGTLLLSPAAASWDQYPSYIARGDHFRALVAPYLKNQDVAA